MKQIDLDFLKKNRPHFPVLIREVLESLNLPEENSSEQKIYLDCTFGAGGYSSFILSNPNTKVIAIDRDETVLPFVEELSNQYKYRFSFHLSTFSNYPEILGSLGLKIDGIVMDLGFSSMQIDNANRGFSFKNDGDLSMKMGLNKTSAYEFINKASQELLADVIFYYGEEHKAKQIAKKIINSRVKEEIKTTKQLANIVRGVVGFSNGKNRTDPATKSFQAIRIYINDELHQLQEALKNSYKYLNENGRLVVVSFHSLEDRIVKDFLNNEGYIPKKYESESSKRNQEFTKNKPNDDNTNNKFKILTKKPILPKEDEVIINPPSSSSKLRFAEKI